MSFIRLDRSGIVHINGTPLVEPYVKHVFAHRMPLSNYGPRQIPEDSYFCMGDNRDQSADSRTWGFVPRSLIKGRALLIWYSFDEDPDAYKKTAIGDRISGILTKVIHAYDRTRWSRIFDVIQ